MVVVSSCLAGIACRFDQTAKPNDMVVRMVREKQAVPACPECMAGLKSPRLPAEISGGDGFDVLDGSAKVYNKEGVDVTEDFIRGAQQFLEFVQKQSAWKVILKAASPSCGVNRIYDGSFAGKKINGSGVTAALLKRNHICVEEV